MQTRPFQKLFGIGLSRTGTTSLAVALLYLGFRTAHYVFKGNDIYRRAEALTDSPIFADFATLDRQHPGSRFVYTTRSADGWLASIRDKLLDGPMNQREQVRNPRHKAAMMNQRVYRQVFGTATDLTDQTLLDGFHQHHDRVMQYFANRPDDLLVLTVDSDDPDEMWNRLCEFTGRRVPGTFPRFRNSSARLWEDLVHPCKVS